MANKTHDLNFEDIKSQYNADLGLLYHLLPQGVLRGSEFRAGSIKGEAGDSFGYNINTGIYADFATGDRGGSIIDLVMAVKGFSTPLEAAKYIVDFRGGAPVESTPRVKKKTVETLTPAPRGIPAPTKVYAEGKNHDISSLWAYRDKFGDVLMYDVRVDLPKGGKLVMPMHWQNGAWYAGTVSKNRPLYQLDKIAGAGKILIVEGCKTADALQQYMGKSLVITWQGGSNAVAKTDWTPLRGRSNIIIIPDADDPGRKAALQIANLLVDMDCKVKICDTSSMESVKQGWDFADALADGWNADKVFDFILDNCSTFGEENEQNNDDKDPDVFETETPEIVVREQSRATLEYYDEYFKCLGYNEGVYFYYVKATGILHTMSPRDHTKSNMIALAPLSFWETHFTNAKQVDWIAAADYFIRVQEKIGMYDYTKVRGRGAWLDDGHIVLHIGDKLIVDDVPTEIHAFSTKYHYERRPPMYLPLQTVLPDKYSEKFIELCQMARWRNHSYGEILAGWVFASMVGGIFPMRSHIYIDGEKKSGKSWLINNVVAPALGDNKLAVEGATTEAGIRSALRADTLPVIFDESEAEQKTDALRLQGVFNLARAAATSDGGAILKGATNGQPGGVRYTCRSAFLFASINVSMAQAADLSRTLMLSLRGKPNIREKDEIKKADYENFLKMSAFASKLLTPDYCRCLFTRAIKLAPSMLKSAKMISDCASRQLGDRRIGDQLGMVGAGAWHLRHQEQIDETNAKELIKSLNILEEKQHEEDDNEMALQWLLAQEISMNIDGHKTMVRLMSLIEQAMMTTPSWARQDLLMNELNTQGIDIKNNQLYLSVASAHYPSRTFNLSQWGQNGWKSALLRLPFSQKTIKNHYFCKFTKALAIMIPMNTIGEMGERNEI